MTPTNVSGWYRKFSTRLWSDPTFLKLSASSPCAQILLVFLLTCKEGQFIPGVVCLGIAAIAEILNWEVEATKRALGELVDTAEVFVDLQHRVLFIPRAVATNEPQNPNMVLGWRINWNEIPDCELKRVIWDHLSSWLRSLDPPSLHATFMKACPKPSMPIPMMAPPGSGGRSEKGSRNRSENGSVDITTRITNKSHYQEEYQDNHPDQGTSLVQVGPGCGLVGAPPSGCSLAGEDGAPGSWDEVLVAGQGTDPERPFPHERTFDDIDDWLEQHTPTKEPPPAPSDQRNPCQRAAWELIHNWNEVAKLAGHPLTTVEGKAAEAMVPAILETLKDPAAADDFKALFQVIPRDSFYKGAGKKGWYATLEHYVLQAPEKRHHAANIARQKLGSMDADRIGNKPVAERLALEALKKRQGGPSPTGGRPSQILNLVRKGD